MGERVFYKYRRGNKMVSWRQIRNVRTRDGYCSGRNVGAGIREGEGRSRREARQLRGVKGQGQALGAELST